MYNPLKNTTMKKLILLCIVVLMMQSCNVTVEIPVPDDNSLTSEQRDNICWTSDTTSLDRKSTRLNSSHYTRSRMPSSA